MFIESDVTNQNDFDFKSLGQRLTMEVSLIVISDHLIAVFH